MIQEFIDTVWSRISDALHTLFAPIQWIMDWWPMLGHYTYFALFVALCCFAGFFLPFKWIRAALGFAIIVFGAFIAGETNQFKKHLEDVRRRRR